MMLPGSTFLLLHPDLVQAKAVFRKRGLAFAPHVATLAGSGIVSGLALATNPLGAKENIHDRVAEQMAMIFSDVKATATEFNARGDYGAGKLTCGTLVLRAARLIMAVLHCAAGG